MGSITTSTFLWSKNERTVGVNFSGSTVIDNCCICLTNHGPRTLILSVASLSNFERSSFVGMVVVGVGRNGPLFNERGEES